MLIFAVPDLKAFKICHLLQYLQLIYVMQNSLANRLIVSALTGLILKATMEDSVDHA